MSLADLDITITPHELEERVLETAARLKRMDAGPEPLRAVKAEAERRLRELEKADEACECDMCSSQD